MDANSRECGFTTPSTLLRAGSGHEAHEGDLMPEARSGATRENEQDRQAHGRFVCWVMACSCDRVAVRMSRMFQGGGGSEGQRGMHYKQT
jgi:hypothetical protein